MLGQVLKVLKSFEKIAGNWFEKCEAGREAQTATSILCRQHLDKVQRKDFGRVFGFSYDKRLKMVYQSPHQ